FLIFILLFPLPLPSSLFPYTTLFRSCDWSFAIKWVTDGVDDTTQHALADWRRCNLACRFDSHAFVNFSAFTENYNPDVVFFKVRSEEHTSELQSLAYLVCRLLLEKKN